MSTLLIVNPHATTTRGWVRDAIADGLSELGSVEVVTTTHRGHATALAAEARRAGVPRVATFGGDGTINETVNGLLAAGPGEDVPTLLPIPGGHTNVLPRVLGIPQDPLEATGALTEAARSGWVRHLGLGRADDRWFLFSAGAGLDAEVLRRVEQQRAHGARASIPRYVATAVLAHAQSLFPGQPQLSIAFPDGSVIDAVYTAVIQNAPVWTYAGSLPVTFAPDADFERGLAVFGIRSLDPLRLANHLALATLRPAWLDGASAAGDLAEFELRSAQPMPLQVDGDVVGERTRVSVRHHARVLPVAVPG